MKETQLYTQAIGTSTSQYLDINPKLHNNTLATLTLIESKSGMPSASYENKFLHSKYDPSREATQIINNIVRTNFDAIIVFEMGLGYVVESLYAQFPNTPIIIIQMNPHLYSLLISSVNFDENTAIKNSKLFVAPTKQVIIEYLYCRNIVTPLIITTQAAKNIYNYQELISLQESITDYSKTMMINHNTLKKFRYRWLSNIIQNFISHTHSIIPIYHLKNIFLNMPCLLCAAGSSLEYIVPHLTHLSKRMPIICVDTALPILHEANIAPDFIVSADPQYINSQHLEWCLSWALERGSMLVLDITSSAQITHMIPHNTTIFTNNSTLLLSQFIAAGTTINNELNSGGSVAHLAWDLCRFMGSKDIFTTGLDFSYPDKRNYCRGTLFEKQSYLRSSLLNSAENHSFRSYYNKTNTINLKSYRKETIKSSSQLLEYLYWMEQQLINHPEIHLYSFVDYTAEIRGNILSTINHVNNLTYKRDIINNIKSKVLKNCTIANKERFLSNILRVLTKLTLVKHKIETTIEEINKYPINVIIDIINDCITNNIEVEIIQFFYQDIIEKKLELKNLPLLQSKKIDIVSSYANKYLDILDNAIQTIQKYC